MNEGRERLFPDVRFDHPQSEVRWVDDQCVAWRDTLGVVSISSGTGMVMQAAARLVKCVLVLWAARVLLVLQCCGVLYLLLKNGPSKGRYYTERLLVAFLSLFAAIAALDVAEHAYARCILMLQLEPPAIHAIFSAKCLVAVLIYTVCVLFVLEPPVFFSTRAIDFFAEWSHNPRTPFLPGAYLFGPSSRLRRSRPVRSSLSLPPDLTPRRHLGKGMT